MVKLLSNILVIRRSWVKPVLFCFVLFSQRKCLLTCMHAFRGISDTQAHSQLYSTSVWRSKQGPQGTLIIVVIIGDLEIEQ